jgi:hypothetical protein
MKKKNIFGKVLFFVAILISVSLVSSYADAAYYMKDASSDNINELGETYYILHTPSFKICKDYKTICEFKETTSYLNPVTRGSWVCNKCTQSNEGCYDGIITQCVAYFCLSASDCMGGWTCDTKASKCTEKKICDEGKTQCNGETKLDTCKGNEWVTTDCPSSEKCDTKTNACAKVAATPPADKSTTTVAGSTPTKVTTDTTSCTDGATKCKDITIVQKCKNNIWVDYPCNPNNECKEKDGVSECNPKSGSTTTGSTPATPACSTEKPIPFSKEKPCKCGDKTDWLGFCCLGKTVSPTEVGCYNKCDEDKILTAPCLCGGNEKTNIISDFKNKVCCKNNPDNEKIQSSLDKCTPDSCDDVCYKTNDLTGDKKCVCPKQCIKSGTTGTTLTSASEDKTCGAYDAEGMCDTIGECMSEENCRVEIKKPEEQKTFVVINNAGFICLEKDDVCCEYKVTDDMKPTYLWDCTSVCKNPAGCVCPDSCISLIQDKKLPSEAIFNGKLNMVKKSFSCNGKYYLDQQTKTTRCVRATKDYFCPPGCFWWNDRDCGRDANMGNVIWDFIPMKNFKKQYEEGWAKKMRDLGARFDLMYWGQSVCNPSSNNYILKDQGDDALIGTSSMVGWIGAKKDYYGESNYSYAVVWYIAGLYENNIYTISLKNNQNELFLWNKREFNISAGEIHQNTTTASVIGRVSYDKVCINFNNSIKSTGPDSLNPDGNSVKEVCRSI